ncbi:peptidylprolyl isomerase [Tunicatimonas pelagia]|uniref:peptidylprolyl isomerase n=1 Tax=Tunicatimonas pelagia TaxID=931531 RepID=UPI002665D245|nr:peptidylprolyl isomerase [Tunicatimonas pelagia]WKN44708.1 peptidylprolyl isomerase [Tunicatimonas pelagia]
MSTEYGDMRAILYDTTPKHKKNFIELAQSGKYDSVTFHRVIEDFMIQTGDLATRPGSTQEDAVDYTIEAEFVDTLFHKKGALAAARQGDQINPKRASSGSQFYIVQGTVLSREELTIDMRKLNDGVGQLLQRDNYDSVREELLSLYNSQQFDAYTQKLMSLKPELEEKLGIKVEKSYAPERLEAYTTKGGAPHLDDTYTVFGEVIDGFDVIDSIAAQPTGARAIEKPNQDIYMVVDVEEVSKKKITQQFGYEFPVQ